MSGDASQQRPLAAQRDDLYDALGLPWSASTPHIEPDTIVRLDSDDWQHHGPDTEPLVLHVMQVRPDLSRPHDGQTCIDGIRLDPDGLPLGPVQVLVSTRALRARGYA